MLYQIETDLGVDRNDLGVDWKRQQFFKLHHVQVNNM